MRKITNPTRLASKANTLRRDVVRILAEAGSGHSAGALGMADVFAVLYFNEMRYDPKRPRWPKRDRLVLSNGHICPILYTAMAHVGYFPRDELKTLRDFGSRLQGHPHNLELPGIENSGGPLGQGISIAVGMALAAKMDGEGYRVFCTMGDGELQEGQCWEAFMAAAKYKLNNLIVIVDRNYIQIDGNTEDVMPLKSVRKKFKAFNWHVVSINGNDASQILAAFKEARTVTDKPIAIIAHTTPGKGVSFMENKSEWHGKSPSDTQAHTAVVELCDQYCQIHGLLEKEDI